MNNLSTDRDSLVALDALMRIRESCDSFEKNKNTNKNKNVNKTNSYGSNKEITTSRTRLSGCGLNHLLPRNPAIMFMPQVRHPCYSQLAVARAQAAAAANWGGNPFSSPPARSNNTMPVPSDLATTNNSTSPHAKTLATKQIKKVEPMVVSQDKIEAALRSKPQRGRKRDDLSDKERLELTRTRNREHAKSTR
jgi:hypothetical protein